MELIKTWKSPWFLLGVIVLLGAILRLQGVDHGLPYLYSFDETIFVDKARHMLAAKDPNPRWFGAPASTLIYLLVILYGFLFVGGRLTGFFASPQDFKTLYYTDPTLFYLSGRLLNTAFSIALIPLVYLIAQKVFKKPGLSLVAAALMAFNPIMLHNSALVRMDTLMTLLLMAAFYCCVSILDLSSSDQERHRVKLYGMASFLTGLAIATKYPSIVFVAVIVATFLFAKDWAVRGFQKFLISAASCTFGVFIGSPFLFIDFKQVLQDVAFEARSEHVSATGEGFFSNVMWYVSNVLPHSFSYFGLVLLLIGIVACIRSRQPKQILLLAFPLITLAFISSLSLRWERWLIPAFPCLALVIAASFDWLSNLAKQLKVAVLNRRSPVVSLALATALILPLFVSSATQARELMGADTRTIARDWMMENLEPDSRLLMEVYAPQLPKETFQYMWSEDGTISEFTPEQSEDATFRVRWSVVGRLSLEEIQAKQVDYVVLSNMYDRYAKEQERYPEIIDNYNAIFEAGELVYEDSSIPGKKSGPAVRIYQLSHQKLSAGKTQASLKK